MRRLAPFLGIAALALAAPAQPAPPPLDVVTLHDRSIVRGVIVAQYPDELWIDTASPGAFRNLVAISRNQIALVITNAPYPTALLDHSPARAGRHTAVLNDGTRVIGRLICRDALETWIDVSPDPALKQPKAFPTHLVASLENDPAWAPPAAATRAWTLGGGDLQIEAGYLKWRGRLWQTTAGAWLTRELDAEKAAQALERALAFATNAQSVADAWSAFAKAHGGHAVFPEAALNALQAAAPHSPLYQALKPTLDALDAPALRAAPSGITPELETRARHVSRLVGLASLKPGPDPAAWAALLGITNTPSVPSPASQATTPDLFYDLLALDPQRLAHTRDAMLLLEPAPGRAAAHAPLLAAARAEWPDSAMLRYFGARYTALAADAVTLPLLRREIVRSRCLRAALAAWPDNPDIRLTRWDKWLLDATSRPIRTSLAAAAALALVATLLGLAILRKRPHGA